MGNKIKQFWVLPFWKTPFWLITSSLGFYVALITAFYLIGK